MARETGHRLPPEENLDIETLADIARGGMGRVQLGRIRSGRLAGRFVAVKRLNPEHEKDPAFVDMFLDEAWMTAAIKSPNVIGVEAWGRDQEGLFLAIELVQGVSLSRLMKESRAQKEPFAERTVALLVSQICAGLEVAHDLVGENGEVLGLVHRDLTPGNILVGFDGVVKIADFGIAKAKQRFTETSAGVMKGKPAYMAPEQARGGDVDRRADLFSVGIILFELLAGKRPWGGRDDLETLIAMSATDPPDLRSIRGTHEVFPWLVERCLKRERNDRIGSAREIRDALDAWRAERNFLRDDVAALAAFVQRNTPAQVAWFQRAVGGGLAQGAPTFRDVEEKIDRDRHAKTGDSKVTPTPSSGPSDLKNMPGWGSRGKTGVKAAFNPGGVPPKAPPKSAAPQPTPVPGSLPQVAPMGQLPPPRAPLPNQVDDLAATAIYAGQDQGPPPSHVPASSHAPMSQVPPSQAVVSLRDLTSTMALDPSAPVANPHAASPAPAQRGQGAYGTMPIPPQHGQAAQQGYPPAYGGYAQGAQPSLDSVGSDAAYRGERGGPRPLTSEATAIGSVLVLQKKRSMTKVVLLVVAIVVVALGVAAFFLRSHLPFLH